MHRIVAGHRTVDLRLLPVLIDKLPHFLRKFLKLLFRSPYRCNVDHIHCAAITPSMRLAATAMIRFASLRSESLGDFLTKIDAKTACDAGDTLAIRRAV